MTKKLLYENPSAELLVVRFEDNFLQSGPTFNSVNNTEELLDGGDENF